MEHYLNVPVKKGLFRSPLRDDKNPTCSFTYDKHGRLVLKDFSGDFYGDVFEVVRRVYNLSSYQEAIQFLQAMRKYLQLLANGRANGWMLIH